MSNENETRTMQESAQEAGEQTTDEAVQELRIDVFKDRVPTDHQLPVTFSEPTGWGCLRGLLFLVGILLALAGGYLISSAGGVSVGGIILLVLGLVLFTGGLWLKLFPPKQEMKLTRDGVSYRQTGGAGSESWEEPLSAYRGVVATLEGPEDFDDPGPGTGCSLKLTLAHSSNDERSVELFSAAATYEQGRPLPDEVRQRFKQAHQHYASLFALPPLKANGEEGVVEVPSP